MLWFRPLKTVLCMRLKTILRTFLSNPLSLVSHFPFSASSSCSWAQGHVVLS